MCVKDQVAREVRNLDKNFSRNVAVAVSFGQNTKTRGGKQGSKKAPCLR